ncbi:MAG TPA: TonB-dependent receptor [Steroidobacteraceae bacterium]
MIATRILALGSCSVALAISWPAPPASAQQAASQPQAPQQLETVVVTGIRYSLEQSIKAKREADAVVDVVSAEEIGKLPDKNIADAVQRLPGVNISKASAGEGGLAENDRVSIRGTDPSLTQTLINGHTIATGDWFIQSQVGTVGRSVSYSLLPAELASKIVVYKSAQADLIEGGVAGAVDIQTRRPLDFKKPFTAELTAQAFYNDLPSKTDPQTSVLLNWKNDADNFGALLQGFKERRHERRDGQEFLGYGTIQGNPGDPDAPLVAAHPDLQGVRYPEFINATLLQHQRHRQGGMLDLEWKPGERLSFDLNGFYSHMDAPSYDTSFLGDVSSPVLAGVVPTSYTVRNNTLVAATFPDIGPINAATGAGITPGVVDKIFRPFAASETYFLDLTGSLRLTDALSLSGKFGHSHGIGETPGDLGYEAAWATGGLAYAMNGLGAPAAISFPGVDTTNFNSTDVFTNASWHSIVRTIDQENSGQLDAELALNKGIWQSLKFGARYADHTRDVRWPADGTCSAITNPVCNAAKPAWNGQQYPSNYGHGLNPPPGYINNFWQLPAASVFAFEQTYNPAQTSLVNWQSMFTVAEKTTAGYLMSSIAGNRWRGNLGVRIVGTDEDSLFYVPSDTPTPYVSVAAGGGTPNYFTPTRSKQKFTDVLPSANFRFDLSHELIGRLAVAKTIARPDYSALSPTPTLDDLALSGSGGNQNLKPVRSTNYDATLEWYYAPKALLSAGLFYMDLTSYVAFSTAQQTLFNNTYQHFSVYSVAFPRNIAARNQGVEVAWQQPLGLGFGTYLNFTLADGKAAGGSELYGASKFTGNAELYFENERFSARAAYSYRSRYLMGIVLAVPEHDTSTGTLAVSLNYKINEQVALSFDGVNLNNPILREYGFNNDQPEAFYVNGRQYFLGLRVAL